MSLRPPSLVRDYDDFFSRDPAIVAAPKEPKDRPAWEAKLQSARETGIWTDVVMPGEMPARFRMKQLAGDVLREILDANDAGRVRTNKASQIAFRAAFQGIVDPQLVDLEPKFEQTERFGKLATVDVANYFDAIDPAIVTELGLEALRRARDLSPK
jgi:hypothetical protein